MSNPASTEVDFFIVSEVVVEAIEEEEPWRAGTMCAVTPCAVAVSCSTAKKVEKTILANFAITSSCHFEYLDGGQRL